MCCLFYFRLFCKKYCRYRLNRHLKLNLYSKQQPKCQKSTANYKNILNFENDYKDAKTILLEENYRSTSNILDAANQVIKNNKMRKDKNLWTSRGVGEKIKYYRAYNERDEAQYVIRKIKEII